MIKNFEHYNKLYEWNKIETLSANLGKYVIMFLTYIDKKTSGKNFIRNPHDYKQRYIVFFYKFLNRKDIIEKIRICEKYDDYYDESLNYIISEWNKDHNRDFMKEIEYVIQHVVIYTKMTNKNLKKLRKLQYILKRKYIRISDIDPLGEEDWSDEDIKEQNSNHLDLDPFEEEDWDDKNLYHEYMTNINLRNQNLTNLDAIENLINLKLLLCSHNQLTNLNGIENLVNLEYLHCDNNQLTNLQGIENLVYLKGLTCSNNLLTNLNEIKKLVNLEYLYCYNNQFSKEYLKYLKRYCWRKHIELNGNRV